MTRVNSNFTRLYRRHFLCWAESFTTQKCKIFGKICHALALGHSTILSFLVYHKKLNSQQHVPE